MTDRDAPAEDHDEEPEFEAEEVDDAGFDPVVPWSPAEGFDLGELDADSVSRWELLRELARFTPTDIPKRLHSAYHEGPFERCLLCDGMLSEGEEYEIQKSYRGSEVVVEFAICSRCGNKTCEDFSAESIGVLEAFSFRVFSNLAEAQRSSGELPDGCHGCQAPRDATPGITEVGVCRANQLIFPPIRLCSACEDGLQEQLSQKTRDIFDDFLRDNFPGIPAEFDLSPIRIL